MRADFFINKTKVLTIMNKRTRKVLNVLKTKAKQLGFSRSELKGIAEKISDNLDVAEDASEEDEDSAINEAVDDAMEFLNYSQSAAQRAISNFKKKHNVSDDDDVDDDEDDDDDQTPAKKNKSNQQKGNKKTNKSNDDADDNDADETPAWAKGLISSFEKMSERVSSLEKGNVSKSRKARLEAVLKDTGKFGERRLKEFDRIKDTFKDEDEFDEYLDEISEDLENYNQERADAGLGKLGAPGATTPSKKDITPSKDDEAKPLDEKEIDALVNEF